MFEWKRMWQRSLSWLDGVIFDLRLSLRGVLRDRAFSLTAIATLTIALVLNVAVYTIRDAMVVRGLPMATDSERLAYLALRKPSDLACCPGPIRYSDFRHWREGATAFDDLAFGPVRQPVAFHAGGGLIDTTVARQTTNAFELLGVRPVMGRDFNAGDAIPGAPVVAIVGHEFWTSRLNGRNDIVGLQVQINGAPASIIGVMPEHFAIVFPSDLYMPLAPSPDLESGVIGRLKAGASLEDARIQIDTITSRLQASDGLARGIPLVQTYTQTYVAADAPRIYGALWAGAWFVLLIACANLTNLNLVRTVGRWREFTTRIALGAGQFRMARQMLVESVVLTSIAAAVAWPIIKWTVTAWADATASRYLVLDYSVTSETLVYLLSISLAAALAIVIVPIARVVRLGVNDALKGDARGSTQGLRSKQLTMALVGGQTALAIVLLLGAGVLVRSLEKIVGADTGVTNADQIAIGLIGLPSDQYPTAAARLQFFDRLQGELRTIAGATDVAVASTIPTRGLRMRAIEVDGRPTTPETREQAQLMAVGPGYFKTMGRPQIIGRDFTQLDTPSAPLVVTVNEAFAAAFWPGEQVVGQRVRTVDQNVAGPWRTVVGVVPNVMQGDPTRQRFKPIIYVPYGQQPAARAFVFVRASTPPAETLQAIRSTLLAIDPDVVTEDFQSLQSGFAFDRDWMDLEHADLGKHAAIAPVFAVVALVLSGLGLVAVIAHSVSQRTKEIGVRMAIGAATRDIARMIVREGMRPVTIGLVVGFVAAVATNRMLESQLVGVSPYDPFTMIAGPLVLISVALAGCRIPARRAMRVDPVVALRHE